MTLVTRQTMVDDSGTFIDGTEVDKAFVDQIYGQIDDQVHSTTNPTIKPKATTDEVVAARGSKASLDARLDVSLEEDGTLKTQASLVSAATYQAGLGGRNVALNGDLDDWSSGGSAAPDDWTLTTVTITRTGSGMGDTFQFGTGLNGFAAKLTRAGADGKLKQVVISAANFTNFANVKGQKFGVSMKAKTSLASSCRIVVDDGATTTASSFHTGSNTEEHLSALHTISNSATKLEVYVDITGSNGDSYVGGFTFTFSNLAPGDWQPLSKEAPASSTRAGIISTGSQDIPGTKNFKEPPTFEPGTSSTAAPVSGVLTVNTTAVGNVGAGEDDLMSYTLPANILSANGKALRITAWGSFGATGNNKTIKPYIAGVSLGTLGTTATNDTSWVIQILVVRTGASAELVLYNSEGGTNESGAFGTKFGHLNQTTSAFDTTATCVIKFTGEGTADNDVKQLGLIVEVLN